MNFESFHQIKPENVGEYLQDTMKTPEFKRLIKSSEVNPTTVIQHRLNPLFKKNLLTFQYSNRRLEKNHFTTWMGAIQRREYDNDYIHDLYWLHELCHWANAKYDSSLSISQWHKKMSNEETEAAIISEAYIYMEIDSLREKTFDFEIWVDRFIGNKPSFEAMRRKRLADITCPAPDDFCAMEINKYAKQNYEWTLVWAKSYLAVEKQMEKYVAGRVSMEEHIEWLRSQGGVLGIPFIEEAELFAKLIDFYHPIKRFSHDIR